MKSADAVKSAKETAKKEVEAATGETASSTTTSSSSTAVTHLLLFSLVVKLIGQLLLLEEQHLQLLHLMSPDATYTVSGSTMTINLGQKFALKTVQDLLTEKADLSFGLTLASLPTIDDTTPNTTTVTITEGADGTISSGEVKLKHRSNQHIKLHLQLRQILRLMQVILFLFHIHQDLEILM